MVRNRKQERLVAIKGLSGHELRNANLQNRILGELRTRMARRGESREGSIAALIAETRIFQLGMTRKAFADGSGMHKRAVQNAELPGSHPQHESMSRIYRAWERLGVPDRFGRVLLGLLIPERDETGRPLRHTVDGLYRKWVYQKGHDAFEAASKRTNRQRQPLHYRTLWRRHEVGMVPDFEEVRTIANALGCDLREAESVWAPQRTQQLLARRVNATLVRFLVQLELRFEGLRLNEQSLRSRLKITHSTAKALAHGQMPPLRDVKHLVDRVIPRKKRASFVKTWLANEARSTGREDFDKAFEGIRDANGWTNDRISKLLRIQAPEKRHGARRKKRTRKEPFRPSAELRRMYRENGFSSQAPAQAVIELVTDDSREKKYLTELFLRGVEAQLQRQGSELRKSRLRLHRVLCGVSPDQLAAVCRFTRDELLLIEQGRIHVSPGDERKLISAMEKFPMEKAQSARNEQARVNRDPTSVREAVNLLVERHGSYNALARLLRSDDDAWSITLGRLRRIAAGEEVPPLPLLRRLVSYGGSVVRAELIRDWYDRMPEFLFDHPNHRWRHPLARGVGILVFEKAKTLRDFWEDRLRGDFEYSILTRNMQQLNGRGYRITWPSVSRYLNAAGLRPGDLRRRYLELLFDSRESLNGAVERSPSEFRECVGAVLRRWRREVRRNGKDPGTIEYCLGLTAKELGRR